MRVKDLIFDTDPDVGFVIENGDFKVSESDNQSVELTLINTPGNLRQFPTFGVGIRSEINGQFDVQELRGRIRGQLRSDGYAATEVKLARDGNGQPVLRINGQRFSNNPK
jgi:hypothetical protein